MAQEEDDPYWKLKPPAPTPAHEICSCLDHHPIVLQCHLSYNPISCLECNLEVPPERIGFSAQLAEDLAFWRTFHDSFHHLWLESAEFESWAFEQLSNPTSSVNTRGLALSDALNSHRRCYYWWFQDSGADDFQPTTKCPQCPLPLTSRSIRLVCEVCSIVVAN
jgi:predicted  nucleic acid-binding Zn ribbon protein